MAYGPAAGLEIVDALTAEPALAGLPPAARASAATCSSRLGRLDEARAEFERAASQTANTRERALLLDRAARCGDQTA